MMTTKIGESTIGESTIGETTMSTNVDTVAWATWIDNVLKTVLDRHRNWHKPLVAFQDGETNYRMTELFNDLRCLVPFERDESEVPEEYSGIPLDEWRAANAIVKQLWYAGCARAFGLQTPAPLRRKAKQLTLF